MIIYCLVYVLAIACDICVCCFLFRNIAKDKNRIKRIVSVALYIGFCFMIGVLSFCSVAFFSGSSIQNMLVEYIDAKLIAIGLAEIILIFSAFFVVKLDSFSFVTGVLIPLIVLTYIFYIAQLDTNKDEIDVLQVVGIFAIIILFVIGYFLTIKHNEDKRIKQEQELIEYKMASMERALLEQKSSLELWKNSIHDYKNTIFAIESLVAQKKIDEVSQFLGEEIKKIHNNSSVIKSGDSTIDAVLNTKKLVAKEKGVDFSFNIAMPKGYPITDIHMANIVGNLLDNAIEAQSYEDKRFVHINISQVKGLFVLKVINRCTVTPVDFSTKKKDALFHGIGIKSVKQTVELYNGEFSLVFDEDVATATVMVPMV